MSHESEKPNGGLDFEAGLLQPLRRFDASLQDWCSREQASAGARTKAAIADRLALDAGEQKLQECLKESYPDHSLDGNSSLQALASIARGQRTELHQILELVRSHLSHFEGTEALAEQLPAAGGAARKMTSADVVGLLAEQLDIASRNLVKARAEAQTAQASRKKKEEDTGREGRRRDDDDSNHKDRRGGAGDDDDRGGRGRRAAAEKDRGSSRDRRADGGRDRGGARSGGGRGDRGSRSRSRRGGGGEARRQDRDGGRGGRQRDNSRGRQQSRGRGERDNGRDERRRDSSRRDGRGDGGRDARRRESNGARDRDRDDK